MSPTRLPLTAICTVAMGGAAAFFCLAMPAGLFESLVVRSGLPDLLSAAQPPLGMTARLLFAGATGAAAALVTALALVILGPAPRRAARPRYVPPERKETYPESWPRRPLSMEADIGAPRAEPQPVPELAPFAFDAGAHADLPEAEWREVDPDPDPAPLEPEAVAEPAPIADTGHDPVPPPAIAAEPDEDDPISALMERLDAALERKMRQAEAAAPPPPAPPQSDPLSAAQSEEDHIRATLAELQRLAFRNR